MKYTHTEISYLASFLVALSLAVSGCGNDSTPEETENVSVDEGSTADKQPIQTSSMAFAGLALAGRLPWPKISA